VLLEIEPDKVCAIVIASNRGQVYCRKGATVRTNVAYRPKAATGRKEMSIDEAPTEIAYDPNRSA
jgi:hypothetical protein